METKLSSDKTVVIIFQKIHNENDWWEMHEKVKLYLFHFKISN